VVNLDNTQPYSWNLRITQIYCPSRLPEMRALKAPDGCLQYFTRQDGIVHSFNFNSAMAPGQSYSVCFRPESVCKLQLESIEFHLGFGGFISMTDPFGGIVRFQGFSGTMATMSKPFVLRVNSGTGSPRGTEFGFLYSLIEEGNC
jgi:hypothetical protein